MNSLPKTVTRQRRGCDLNPDPSVPESSMLTTHLPSQVQVLHGKGKHWGHVLASVKYYDNCYYTTHV